MRSSFRQILSSTALIGGSSVFTLALGTIRTKVLAVLLGSEGIALISAFQSITNLATTIAGLGLHTSAVRRIADASNTEDIHQTSKRSTALRRISIGLGILGMVLLAVFAETLSTVTFGTTQNKVALLILSPIVFFSVVSNSQKALVQGLRRIRELATINVWAAVLSTMIGLPIAYYYGRSGIAVSLLASAFAALFVSFYYARRVPVPRLQISWRETFGETSVLLRMGVFFMLAAVMGSITTYLIQILVIRMAGLPIAGLYQASTTLASVYSGFVLGAMASDYYPRLSQVASRNDEVCKLVNEQAEAALLLALPGLMVTLLLAPYIVVLLYSDSFAATTPILRWQTLGVFGRIVVWPIAFIILAKGRAGIFFVTELFSNIVHIALIYFCLKHFGSVGLGLAFPLLYLVYGIPIYLIARRLADFRWSLPNQKLIVASVVASLVVFSFAQYGGNSPLSLTVGGIVTVATSILCLKTLAERSGVSNFRQLVTRFSKRKSKP
jgi:antigen flippase